MEKLKIKIASLRSVANNSEILAPENIFTVEATEVNEMSVVLTVGGIRAATGLILAIAGDISIGSKVLKYNFTGKLAEFTKIDEVSSLLRIELLQFDRALWGKFINGSKENQDRADQIFAAIKSDE